MNIFEKLRLAEHWLSVWTQDTVNTLCVKVGSTLAQCLDTGYNGYTVCEGWLNLGPRLDTSNQDCAQ